MKQFKLKLNGNRITRELPSCIEEVTLKMYCNILEAFKNSHNDYALLSGILDLSAEEVLEIPDVNINDLFYHLQWINTGELDKLSKQKIPKHLNLPENKIKLNDNVGQYTLGQFEDAKAILNNNDHYLQKCIQILITYLHKQSDMTKEKFAEVLQDLPAIEVHPVAVFFFMRFTILQKNGMKH